MRIAQKKKRGAQSEARVQAIAQAHQDYISVTQQYLDKARNTVKTLEKTASVSITDVPILESIASFGTHADRQIDQIRRRVLNGEIIPHEEKVFSLFEPHTEWIAKGKAGVPVELGLRVCVLEDQHQFILHHRVMEKETDEQVAVVMVRETKKWFPDLKTCSVDKGFHSKENQEIS